MRFLIFNGIVAAALYYLVTGGFDPAPGLEAIQPLRTAITGALSDDTMPSPVIETALPPVVEAAPPPVVEAAPPPVFEAAPPRSAVIPQPAPVQVQARPAPAPQPVQVVAATPRVSPATPLSSEDLAPLEEIVVAVRPEPVPAPPAGAARIEAEDENIRVRRTDGPAPATEAAQDEPTFMSPRERLAELQRLSEEMELFFVEKTVR